LLLAADGGRANAEDEVGVVGDIWRSEADEGWYENGEVGEAEVLV
jgi:hypothetical protein